MKEQIYFLNHKEYLKKYYKSKFIDRKITKLTEYYKYHKEVPRIFIQKINQILNSKIIIIRIL